MTVLLTGAAGFLGTNLAEDLMRAGSEIVGIDVVPPAEATPFEVALIDVRDRAELRRFMADQGVTTVVHGGGISGPHVANDRPAFVVEVNVLGTTNLLECARELELPGRFVLLSSSSTYGQAAEQASIRVPCIETQALLASEPYGSSKVASEAILRAYVEQFGIDGVSLRVSIVYGAGRQTFCGITSMVRQAIERGTIILDHDCDLALPWIYITDLVSAVRATLGESREQMRNLGTYAFNVTGPGRPTFAEIASIIAELVPGTTIVNGAEPDKYTMNARTMSLAAIQRDLGWSPQVAIDDGVRLLLEHARASSGTS